MEPNHLLIGICGDIGSGKDTVADHLVEKHGFRKLSFAYALKQTCLDMFGYQHDRFFGTQAQKAEEIFPGWSGRKILEFIGSTFREVDPNVWLNFVRRMIETDQLMARGRGVTGEVRGVRHVISDVRYLNEIQMIRLLGGEMWQTEKVGVEPERTGHVSDREWRRAVFNRVLRAEAGDLVSLRMAVDSALLDKTWSPPQSWYCK